jgi:hypothetical protein
MAAHAADAVQWFACHLGNTTWQQLSGLFAILLRQCSAAVCIQSAVCSLRASVSMYYRRRTASSTRPLQKASRAIDRGGPL